MPASDHGLAGSLQTSTSLTGFAEQAYAS